MVAGRAEQADEFLRAVSIGSIVLVVALIAVVAFLRNRPRLALLAAASIAAAVLSTEILKLVLLERPQLVLSRIGDNSYPSGHATVGMAVGIAAMLVVPARLRLITAFGAGAVGAAFGVAVVAAGWHRPSDVVGAYLICLAAGASAAALSFAYPDQQAERGRRGPAPAAVTIGPTELGLIALAVAIVGVFGLAALTVRGIPWTSAGAGFLISSAALALSAFLVTGLLAAAMSATERRSAGLDGEG